MIARKIKYPLILIMLVACSLCGCGREVKIEPNFYDEIKASLPKLPTVAPADERADISIVTLEEKIKSPLSLNEAGDLCVPTQMTKIGDDYFIVDCYHNQILTAKDVNAPLNEWRIFTDCINMGHSIAGDGTTYMVDDTENNRLLVFEKRADGFYMTQEIENAGVRPHFVVYEDGLFYAMSSLTGDFYIFKIEKHGSVTLSKKAFVPEFENVYRRSFSFIDGDIFVPSGDMRIYRLDRDSFKIKGVFNLCPQYGGPVQLLKLGDYFYLTISTDVFGVPDAATLVRAKSIEDFAAGSAEDLKGNFTQEGTPYVISEIDGIYYMSFHSDVGVNGMWSFKIDENDGISEVRRVFE